MRSSLILVILQLWGTLDISLSQNVCADLPVVPHASLSEESRKSQYQPGDVIYFTCETGYVSGPSIKYGCINEVWQLLRKGTCVLKPCPLPEEIFNGNYEIIKGEEFVFGTVIKYHCDEGYQMTSKEPTRTCMLNGWTSRVPVCQPLSCDAPQAEDGLTVNGLSDNDEGLQPGQFLTFSCDASGKRVNGSSRLVCGKDGQWDHPFPHCEDITCKVHEMTPNLQATDLPENKTAKIGHMIAFYCNDGYTLAGFEEVKCLPSGEWDHPFPTCPEKCVVLEIPPSVQIVSNARQGSQLSKGQTIQFECTTKTHAMTGNAVVECLDGGKWKTAFPTCAAPRRCRRPPILADGDIEDAPKPSYQHNDRVKYICQSVYTMQGDPYKTCNNGQWTGSMRCLRPCTVNEDDMKAHNIRFEYRRDDNKLYAPHEDHLTFSCREGTTHDGRLAMRQQCLDGVMTLPTCH